MIAESKRIAIVAIALLGIGATIAGCEEGAGACEECRMDEDCKSDLDCEEFFAPEIGVLKLCAAPAMRICTFPDRAEPFDSTRDPDSNAHSDSLYAPETAESDDLDWDADMEEFGYQLRRVPPSPTPEELAVSR